MPKVTLFQDANFGGKYLTLQQAASNLKNQNFNDMTTAVLVCSGNWRLFQNADFGGMFWDVKENGGPNGDGLYPNSSSWGGKNDSISSVMPL
ncbi:MAG TPA: beta/gamma crystallin-related protein [Pyrinomonadaceae bacterium]|nr:beta/gamma crystallin-related protein [Pyrinomonadaceae bacterium]